MMTDKSTKEQDNQSKSQRQKDVELQEQAALEQAKKKSEQYVECTRCGYDLYSDEDSEFDGKSGRMHHLARCFELACEANARMKDTGAKDPDDEVRAKKKADLAKDSKAKSIEANQVGLNEIVAGRNLEPWQIELRDKGSVKQEAPKAEKKTAEQKVESKKEVAKEEKQHQDKQQEHVHGEKEHHE